jgi:hypothetical protein
VRHPIVAPFLAAVSLALLEYPGVPAANLTASPLAFVFERQC